MSPHPSFFGVATSTLVFFFFFFFLSSSSSPATIDATAPQLRVCGYYCGPNWCANQVISETNCVQDNVWGSPSEAGSCADACCKVHDHCCGEGTDRPSCNDAIVQCLTASSCYKSVCGALVWTAMKVVSDWCCGGPCPTSLMTKIEHLVGFNSSTLAAAVSQPQY